MFQYGDIRRYKVNKYLSVAPPTGGTQARVLSAIRHYKRKPKITQGNLRVINTEKIVVRISYNTYETLLWKSLKIPKE